MSKIKTITATEILDSRGNPTVQTTVILEDGSNGISSIPSGISIGKYEAVEIRDNDPKRFGGMGVLKAVANVNQEITPKILGMDASDQRSIDHAMVLLDGTSNKSKLGANSILSISQAVCKAQASSAGLPLYRYINNLAVTFSLPDSIKKMPTPTFNILNGGKHGAGNLDFQEFLIIPPTSKSYYEGLELGVNTYKTLKLVLTLKNAIHSVGDEGGFAPNLYSNTDALEILSQAVREQNLRLGYDIFFGLDCAASNFRTGNKYKIRDRDATYSTDELVKYYVDLNIQYKLLIMEDPFEEDDWDGWIKLRAALGNSMIIVGDDLIATNSNRLQLAIEKKAVTGVLVKPNQIGTVSETLWLIENAKRGGLIVVVSHRSGETNDTFIADLAVATSSDYVKFGAPARGERVAKYNRLLEIESELFKV